MNFFEAQDQARRNTALLVFLFAIAVIALIGLTNILAIVALEYYQSGTWPTTLTQIQASFSWNVAIAITLVITSFIGVGSLYKIASLGSGGRAVAETLGGRLISSNTQEPQHRKLLNIVEEMSIAAGTSVPSVYLLNEPGINAFAAGWTSRDAVIGITQGALDYLSRDELQGVIAHEFSHIFNGDMKLNIHLIGILHGILVLGMLGYYLLRSIRFTSSTNKREGGSGVVAILALGVGLVVLGSIGTFFGYWIKSIVSRQREFLADASAVRFTRNPNGIAGALKKIGGLSFGSQLRNPAAHEFSHCYFSQGVDQLLGFLFATHPPLRERIYRVDPQWSGRFVTPKITTSKKDDGVPEKKSNKDALKRQVVTTIAATALAGQETSDIGQSGWFSEEKLGYARSLIEDIPSNIRQDIQDPYGVRAILYALFIHEAGNARQSQWNILRRYVDVEVFRKTQELVPLVHALDQSLSLPLIDLSMPALRSLSLAQYKIFRENVRGLIKADRKIELREWILQRLITRPLDQYHRLRKPAIAKYSHLGAVKNECEILLTLICYVEHNNKRDIQAAFEFGRKESGFTALQQVPYAELNLQKLEAALHRLEQLKLPLKFRFMQAVVASVLHDGRITPTGLELTRIVANCLDSPMPRLEEHRRG